ncbi:MAG TPA: sugar transferase [Solirubrobacteraceae bacterium]|nr:sugar transferase [Solirubrobacteraceae bacterium]
MIRRAFDVALAASALLLSAPLLASAAVAIKLTSRGPVLYRQTRAGLHGHRFEVIKLRTMVQGAEFIGAGMAVEEGDARITRIGGLLRRTSIDELPNLWNVLRGEMSVIGPRPTLPEQIEAYDARQRRRLDVRPGITGWAQVNGRAALPWSERIELDIHYVENRSLRLDATILLRTLRIVFGGDGGGGLYHPGGGGFDL